MEADERRKMKNIKLLLSKPSHKLQTRNGEIEEIDGIFESLRKDHPKPVISIFMLGAPACGKTQLARQYGEKDYDNQIENLKKFTVQKKIAIVGTLDVRNESSLWLSYSRLAIDLRCEVQTQGQLKDRLAVLKATVRNKFQENPGWLLIVDGINEQSK